MGRLIVANLLVFAVLASAAALAYYGWSYTAEVSSRERAIIRDTIRELADEKIIGIEHEIVETDKKVFAAVHLDRPFEIKDIIAAEQAPVRSVYLLDAELHLIPGGVFSKRQAALAKVYRDRFETRILPTLPLRSLPVRDVSGPVTRGHVHNFWDGEEYLFSFSHRVEGGRDYYIVLETDLNYLISDVFPQFFLQDAPRLYQVIDEYGVHIYGQPFKMSSGAVVVELPFVDTVDRWRLQVAARDTVSSTSRSKRKVIDIVLISLALAGIVAGLGVLMLAMRRERKANALKSDFISNVSHELKTPLSIISMFGEMLALGRIKTPAQATEYAEIIWRESVRLARLIDNVLDFAKIERGKDVYEFAEGDVAEVVTRAIELSAHRLQKAELVVETDLAQDLPPTLLDSNAVTLAVLNLIDNAIKYAGEGKKLTLRLRRDGDRIVLDVKDEGPGIDPDEHGKIFERFYRARAVRLKPIRGSGIGLALVEHIARAHKGGVSVSSEVGKGATFGFWIPIRADETGES